MSRQFSVTNNLKKTLQIALFFLLFVLVFKSVALASSVRSDTLSSTRIGQLADHTIVWGVEDADGIAEGDGFTISFDSSFDTSDIALADISITDDGTTLSLASDCSGSSQISFSSNGNGLFTFTVCAGNGGAILSGSTIGVEMGLVAAGSHQVVNPSSAGSYVISFDGTGGYSDSFSLNIAILSGVSVSAIVPSLTGDINLSGYTSPHALVSFSEGGSVIGTQSADDNGYFSKTITGFDEGLHTIVLAVVDTDNRLSDTVEIIPSVTAGATIYCDEITMPPTFDSPQSTIKRPAAYTVYGQARPSSTVQISISGSNNDFTQAVNVAADGTWSVNINNLLHLGDKELSGLTAFGGYQSRETTSHSFSIVQSADIDNSGLVDDDDLSDLRTEWDVTGNVVSDINDDAVVDISDFGIMLYEWN